MQKCQISHTSSTHLLSRFVVTKRNINSSIRVLDKFRQNLACISNNGSKFMFMVVALPKGLSFVFEKGDKASKCIERVCY